MWRPRGARAGARRRGGEPAGVPDPVSPQKSADAPGPAARRAARDDRGPTHNPTNILNTPTRFRTVHLRTGETGNGQRDIRGTLIRAATITAPPGALELECSGIPY